MRTSKSFKRFLTELLLGIYMVTIINPLPALAAYKDEEIVYPLKEISKLECRFNDFKDLTSGCKEELPKLKTKDYSKYAKQNWGYNKFTRLYTVLWWASYKYGWDVWYGGHIWTDIATAKWTPVYSMAKWIVIKSKYDNMLGNLVVVEHSLRGKKVFSSYAHMSKIHVKEGKKLKAWELLWEVGSTWNSTWNHLHFQVDLDTPFHPYYYDYKRCPFSYYEITEWGQCIDELVNNTVDPLELLETKWKILDNYDTKTYNYDIVKKVEVPKAMWEDLSIFNRTVYTGYKKADIKKVQKIYRAIWVYKGLITWKYEDVEKDIIKYQIQKGIIKDENWHWAGWFGPKTRHITKADYIKYLESWETAVKEEKTVKVFKSDTVNTNTAKKKIQKIDRSEMMSREEIEKKEVEDFLKYHKLYFNFKNEGWNIKEGTTTILDLKITDRKGKKFRWSMPWGMTFEVSQDKVDVFPKKLFYFTDWQRDIKVTWKKEWNTNLYIKIGTQTIKTIPIKVFKAGKAIYPTSSKIISPSQITLWDKQTWIAIFKDNAWKSLINLKYGSTFKIKATDDNKVCIKRGSIKNIKKIYKSDCSEADYKNEIDFDYSDTVWGLLIYDFKATSKNFNVKVINNYNNVVLSQKTVAVKNPKGLTQKYAYTNEVMDMLEEWVVDGIKKGKFLEQRGLTQRDAFNWIENALIKMEQESYDSETEAKIKASLAKVQKAKPYSSKTKVITRSDFLDLNHTYLVMNDLIHNWTMEYRDINNETRQKLEKIFDKDTTWKDKFGHKYFQPDNKITRWEWAFFLAQTLEKNDQAQLAMK